MPRRSSPRTPSRTRVALTALTALLLIAWSTPARAAESVFAPDGVAIRGYDAVAYFEDGAPVEGDARFTVDWNGATWRFADAAHRDAFRDNPERYAPQYGGWCAWAVAQNDVAPTDPQAWKIVDGKLYLNYSARIQRKWEKDIPGNVRKADGNWPELRDE